MPCAVSIKNGMFIGSCSGEYSSTCQFSCNAPYYKSAINTNSLTCGTMGQWLHGNAQVNNTDILCTGSYTLLIIPYNLVSFLLDIGEQNGPKNVATHLGLFRLLL